MNVMLLIFTNYCHRLFIHSQNKKHLVLTHLESSVSVTYPPTNQYLCALKTVNDFSVDTYKLFIRFIDLLSISKTTDYDTHPQKRFCDPNMTNIL